MSELMVIASSVWWPAITQLRPILIKFDQFSWQCTNPFFLCFPLTQATFRTCAMQWDHGYSNSGVHSMLVTVIEASYSHIFSSQPCRPVVPGSWLSTRNGLKPLARTLAGRQYLRVSKKTRLKAKTRHRDPNSTLSCSWFFIDSSIKNTWYLEATRFNAMTEGHHNLMWWCNHQLLGELSTPMPSTALESYLQNIEKCTRKHRKS